MLTGVYNLTKYIIDPLRKNIDKSLESYLYYDVCQEDELTTNQKGVDIIAHQLELQFEASSPIYISWGTIEGWFQYSLCVSEKSFCSGTEMFTKKDNNWADIIGKALKRFEVYGYKENIITSTEMTTGKRIKKTYYNEPHLLILYFDDKKYMGVANFYLEDDFIPKLPMGDDIWVIFDKRHIDNCIKTLSLELLYI